jgi:imidazolonepropionase-like amidohydrolase
MRAVNRIAAGWLIDGSGGPVRENVLLEVRDGLIRTVEALRVDGLLDGGFEDFRHCTLVPALVDSHVHLAMSGATDPATRARQLTAGYAELAPVIAGNRARLLAAGVVAVRDAGDRGGFVRRFLRDEGGRGLSTVRVKAAGRAWHRPGRYGGLIGRALPPGRSLAAAVAGDRGRCDVVKVVNSGLNSLTEFGRQTPAQFDPAELKAAVAAAGGRGLEVMVHANGIAPVRAAVLAGCRSIEHGFFMGADNLGRMAEKEVAWVPTAVTMQAYAGHLAQTGQDPDVARRTLDHQIEQLALARRLAVTVALGTDSGSPGVDHGTAVATEMKLLIQAGYTLPEAVRCATANGWELIGGAAGLIEPGRPATFIAVDDDPSGLPAGLHRVRAVFVDGIKRSQAG